MTEQSMTDLLDVLKHMGFLEVRTAADARSWTPTAETGGQLDGETTDSVHVIVWKRKATAELRDSDTGERVGEARQSCPIVHGRPETEGSS